MKISGEQISSLSATDLSNHLGCRHLTQLNRLLASNKIAPPDWSDPNVAHLRELGEAHEKAYTDFLLESRFDVVELSNASFAEDTDRTLSEMKRGADVIVQAVLTDGKWAGRADFLVKTDSSSDLGAWSYEVIDTKLAQQTRAGTVLQLCLYTEMIGKLQGVIPSLMHVVKPGEGFPRETFRFADFSAYYRLVKAQLEEAVGSKQDTYPIPVDHCAVCRWWKNCDKKWHEDDHLSLVAGMSSRHRAEFEDRGITTLEQLAGTKTPFETKPAFGSKETYEKLQNQARIQAEGRKKNKLLYELLELEPARGFCRLPEPDDGDVFFDIESARFVEDGGIEYLFGFVFRGNDKSWEYKGYWSGDRVEERNVFEASMDSLTERAKKYPNMHIYHFAPYEPSALKRLMGRYNSRAAELDQFLRGGRFVDLHGVAKQGLRASVESYSLKELERFCDFERKADLREASSARRRIEFALELASEEKISKEDRKLVQQYNEDDCIATKELRDWLELRRKEVVDSGQGVSRPQEEDPEPSENVKERDAAIQVVYDQLVKGLPEDPAEQNDEQRGYQLLADMLAYFSREEKSTWWDYFRMREMEYEEAIDERKAVAGLEFVKEIPPEGRARLPVHCYKFPPQEVSLSEGDELVEILGDSIGKLCEIDHEKRILSIKKMGATVGVHPSAVFVKEYVRPFPIDHSLLEFGRSAGSFGGSDPVEYQAAFDLLMKSDPRFTSGYKMPKTMEAEKVLDQAVEVVKKLDGGVLAIQGPPGTGKTYSGARMIVELVGQGKKIAVTAVSHKVIVNLLEETRKVASAMKVQVKVAHKDSKKDEVTGEVPIITDKKQAVAELVNGTVVGATAWVWADDVAVGMADYLFVDEAGQMALAQVLAAARCTKNLVLLGDPQQLEQPQKGVHPEGADADALTHLLDGQKTIPSGKGIFLGTTRRLHPDIARFTSELYYEDRLTTLEGLDRQKIVGSKGFDGSGLFFVPVEHEGNQNNSVEEVEEIVKIVKILLKPKVKWIGSNGVEKQLKKDDILIVAPYNAQVSALVEAMPGMRIGTVDKFQGQEAAVVIYSMASSSAEDAPRGMGFLYSPNRLNVATSRARCTCILVASPRLLEPECRTPDQMRWANGLCRFKELAAEVQNI